MSRCLGTKSVGACLDVLPAPAPAPSARELLAGRTADCRWDLLGARDRGMDTNPSEQVVARALALALLRQTLVYLGTAQEAAAAGHTQRAIDILLRQAGLEDDRGPLRK